MTKQDKLAEAEEQYHALLTGTAVVSVDVNGRKVQYTQANRSALKQYIEELKSSIGVTPSRAGPAGVWF